jgi:hypothetical protein
METVTQKGGIGKRDLIFLAAGFLSGICFISSFTSPAPRTARPEPMIIAALPVKQTLSGLPSGDRSPSKPTTNSSRDWQDLSPKSLPPSFHLQLPRLNRDDQPAPPAGELRKRSFDLIDTRPLYIDIKEAK